MKPSRILLASVFITAVILAMVGGITSLAMAKAKSTASDQKTVEDYQQREAEYQQLIEKANQQLAEANQKLQAVQGINGNNQQLASPTSTSAVISADNAEQLARQVAAPGQALLKKGELVNFEGKAAYEFPFLKGSIYVDAQSGKILFNGTIPQDINADRAVQIASDYLKNKDVLQVDEISFRGAQIYRVIFKPGIMVYLDKTGQITYMLKIPPKVVGEQASSSSGGATVSSGGFTEPNDHAFGFDD